MQKKLLEGSHSLRFPFSNHQSGFPPKVSIGISSFQAREGLRLLTADILIPALHCCCFFVFFGGVVLFDSTSHEPRAVRGSGRCRKASQVHASYPYRPAVCHLVLGSLHYLQKDGITGSVCVQRCADGRTSGKRGPATKRMA